MYNSLNVAERIKLQSKSKKITLKQMLEDCNLNKDMVSTMSYRSSMPKADNIALIADYLDCSIDYLMGRTDNPEVNR